MANKRISELTSASALTLNDLLALVNEAQTKKVSISTLLSFIAAQDQFATLDSNGKIPLTQIPDSLIGSLQYQTTWNADLNLPAIPTASASNRGWYFVVGTAGETIVDSISNWNLGDWIISNGEAWQKIDNTDAVSSWNNRKGAVVPESGDYTTDEVTEAGNKYFTEVRALATLLAGLSATNGTITTSDSVLSAFGKAQGQINEREVTANKGQANGYAGLDSSGKVPTAQLPSSVLGAANYQGTWDGTNASTILGTASGTNKGFYYVLSADSSVDVNGISDFKVGDWVISNGTAWQKVDNTDALVSWNGRIGAVVPQSGDYTTTLVTEGTSLYYTAARVLAEMLAGFSATNSAINASDTILTAFGKAQGQLNNRELTSNKGIAGGYAGLDGSGKVTAAQLPTHVQSWNGRTGAVVPISGDYTTTLVTEGTNKYYTAARVLAEVLAGFSTSNSAITASDPILTAFGKAQGQINARELTSNRGIASGYAGLDTNARVPKAQLPKGEVSLALDFSGYAVGSVTTEVVMSSKQISAGTLASGDQLNISTWLGLNNGGSAKTFRVYLGTIAGTAGSAVPGGATLIGTYTVTTNAASVKFEREVSFLTNTTMKAGVAAATSSLKGDNTSTLDSAITIPTLASNFHVIITGQKVTAGDTLRFERLALTAFLQ